MSELGLTSRHFQHRTQTSYSTTNDRSKTRTRARARDRLAGQRETTIEKQQKTKQKKAIKGKPIFVQTTMPPQTKEVHAVDDDVRNRGVAIVADGVSVEVPFPEKEQEQDINKLGYEPAAPDSLGDTSAEEAPEPLFSFLTGMKHDLRARQPYYNCRTSCFDAADATNTTTKKDEPSNTPQGYAYDDYQIRGDWSVPKHFFTVFNATIFAFVIQLIPALIFAELMDRQTDGNLATAETLLSSAIIGIMYAIGSGQPLVIMGITGPVSLLLGTSYGLAAQFNADYFPFFFWICFWAGLMHIVTAVVGLVSLVWKVTPFTTQIFELFIAITFIYSALRDLITPIHFSNSPTMEYYDQDGMRQDLAVTPAIRAAGYASFLIGLVTCAVAWSLHFAETWLFFNKPVRYVPIDRAFVYFCDEVHRDYIERNRVIFFSIE